MKFDSVLLLPVLAVLLATYFKAFKNRPNQSTSLKSRKRRKNLLIRFTIFVLLLSTLFAMLVPFQGVSKLMTALILCFGVLTPVYLIHLFMTLHYGNRRQSAQGIKQTERQSYDKLIPDETVAHLSEPGLNDESTDTLMSDLVSSNLSSEVCEEVMSPSWVDEKQSEAQDEILAQLERTADQIDAYDIGSEEYLKSDEKLEQSRLNIRPDVPMPAATALTKATFSSTELSKLSTNEIVSLITELRTDKTNLQKLVVAQQSAIESERVAHDQSRTVARDAIKIMRDSRNAQKMVEKQLRRERAQRQRVEQQYKKVARALDNALSIIDTRKAEKPTANLPVKDPG